MLFIFLGTFVGTIGTLVGAGGGFILTPVLLLFFPKLPPSAITAISMSTVFFNASSGTAAYFQMKRIDYKTGLIFLAFNLPGSIFGTMVTYHISKSLFNIIFGIVMLLISAFILIKSRMKSTAAPIDKEGFFRLHTRLADIQGNTTQFSYNLLLGIILSVFVGFVSGFLGIGGGVVQVPSLILLGFPAVFATATSQFIVAFSSITSLAVHIQNGSFNSIISVTVCIATGAVAGAQIGAWLSKKVKGSVIMICLAVTLVLVGIRIFVMGITG